MSKRSKGRPRHQAPPNGEANGKKAIVVADSGARAVKAVTSNTDGVDGAPIDKAEQTWP